jgi:hypothetical protein
LSPSFFLVFSLDWRQNRLMTKDDMLLIVVGYRVFSRCSWSCQTRVMHSMFDSTFSVSPENLRSVVRVFISRNLCSLIILPLKLTRKRMLLNWSSTCVPSSTKVKEQERFFILFPPKCVGGS